MAGRGRPKKIVEQETKTQEESLLAIIERLSREIEQLKNSAPAPTNTVVAQLDDDEFIIGSDKMIKVISLYPSDMNLSTKRGGEKSGATVYTFRKFGDLKLIRYGDLALIIDQHRHFAEAGMFYICDDKVIRRHGLDEAYKKVLKKEEIEKILVLDAEGAVGLYNSATKYQQELMVDLLVSAVRDGKDIDMNVVSKLSRISKRNIDGLAEEAKEYMEG